jgi:uncharacterized protein YqfA (UPF0365 family)
MNYLAIIGFAFVLFIILFLIFYYFSPGYWMAAMVSGVKITFIELFLMRVRKLPVHDLVTSIIVAAKGGVIVDRDALQAHTLAGGDVNNVVNGMVRAKHLGLELSFKKACEADFRGIDLAEFAKKTAEKEKPQENFFE